MDLRCWSGYRRSKTADLGCHSGHWFAGNSDGDARARNGRFVRLPSHAPSSASLSPSRRSPRWLLRAQVDLLVEEDAVMHAAVRRHRCQRVLPRPGARAHAVRTCRRNTRNGCHLLLRRGCGCGHIHTQTRFGWRSS